MNGDNRDDVIHEIADKLDAVERVPDDVLHKVVTRDGSCMWLYRLDLQPEWSGDDLTDRETASRICAGCPVQRECLELELRTSGAATLGVWGALPADDVRALYPVWRSRRQRCDGTGGHHRAEGGELA
jgi:WhiB family transcriptional regulator, redox-sensing transcriptional regulator